MNQIFVDTLHGKEPQRIVTRNSFHTYMIQSCSMSKQNRHNFIASMIRSIINISIVNTDLKTPRVEYIERTI